MQFLDLPTLDGSLSMPMLGLGTWQMQDENIISTALDLGYPLIDTACIYGNEAIVGSAVHKHIRATKSKREDIFITSKVRF